MPDAFNRKTSFADGWKLAHDRFPNLREFCGGLLTAFTGTATVQNDFPIVNWEKYRGRVSLTEFSLEGILYSQQFKRMRSIEFN